METERTEAERIRNQKCRLRKQALDVRDALSGEERLRKSRRIMETLFEQNCYRNAKRIFCYISFRSEVETQELIGRALSEGRTVACPRVQGKEMKFYEISDFSDCEAGRFGITEPKSSCKEIVPMQPDEDGTDLLLVPGCCFDREYMRIGYGGGYYDRFLAKYPMNAVGLFYECQEMQRIPSDLYDKRLNGIITESFVLNDRMNRKENGL